MIRRAAGTESAHVLRLGASVDRRLQAAPRALGRVHSVFAHAVNVLCHDARLVTLHGPRPLAAPFAAALDHLPRPDLLAPGMDVQRMGGQLVLGELTLDWRGAEVVELTLAPAAGGSALAAALLETPLPQGAPALRSPVALEGRRRLAAGLRQRDARDVVEGALRLVGLGEGLTPAGDDCLVGILAVVRRFRPDFLADHPVIATSIAAAAGDGTTAVGREFLLHALAGDFSEAVVALASARIEDAARAALGDLLSMGATSGADTAVGMRLAAEALAA